MGNRPLYMKQLVPFIKILPFDADGLSPSQSCRKDQMKQGTEVERTLSQFLEKLRCLFNGKRIYRLFRYDRRADTVHWILRNHIIFLCITKNIF